MRPKSPRETWHPHEPLPTFDRSRYPAPLLARAAAAWRRLHDDERASLAAASAVTADLAHLGAPSTILGLAARVIQDEVRHIDVCARVLESLGAEAPRAPREVAPAADVAEPLETRAARTLVAHFAVGESLSAAWFATARASAREPIIAWGYTELLRDEARHGAFGAQAAAWVMRAWPAADRQTLWADCVREMEAFERRLGGPVMPASRTPFRRDTAADALGLLTAEASCTAILGSIPRWVLPHLTTLGIVPPAHQQSELLQ